MSQLQDELDALGPPPSTEGASTDYLLYFWTGRRANILAEERVRQEAVAQDLAERARLAVEANTAAIRAVPSDAEAWLYFYAHRFGATSTINEVKAADHADHALVQYKIRVAREFK